jgi:hypothetical protein
MNNQIEHLSKNELLDQIRVEHKYLEETLARLTREQMLLPGVDGDWSVKDAVAHIAAWEQRMIGWVGSHIYGEEPAVPLPWDVDRMNAETFELVKDKPLDEVLKDFRQSYRDSLTLAESLSEEQLQTIYTDTWPMGPLWTGIAANMNCHYKEHRKDIQKWRKTLEKEH